MKGEKRKGKKTKKKIKGKLRLNFSIECHVFAEILRQIFIYLLKIYTVT